MRAFSFADFKTLFLSYPHPTSTQYVLSLAPTSFYLTCTHLHFLPLHRPLGIHRFVTLQKGRRHPQGCGLQVDSLTSLQVPVELCALSRSWQCQNWVTEIWGLAEIPDGKAGFWAGVELSGGFQEWGRTMGQLVSVSSEISLTLCHWFSRSKQYFFMHMFTKMRSLCLHHAHSDNWW